MTRLPKKLGSPLGTIKSRIFFARKKLQKMYDEAMANRLSKEKKAGRRSA